MKIVLENVSKAFNHNEVLENTSLCFRENQTTALIGPSGCGKTTLLRMIAGFEIPSTGRILIGNTDITDLPPYKRQVNTIFQNYSLFPHMTVFDNVAFGLRIRKFPARSCAQRSSAQRIPPA